MQDHFADDRELMTHAERTLDYLRAHRYIFPLVAIQKLGNTRLADTIYKLRDQGHTIRTDMVEVSTRWGEKARVAKYVLVKEGRC